MKLARRLTLGFSLFFIMMALVGLILPVEQADHIAVVDLADTAGEFATINGIQIYFKDQGTGEVGTMILMHGLFGSTESWRYNASILVDAGFRVIRFDRPAFGLSDKRADIDYSIANQADLTAALMDRLMIERAIILGHSAGGNLATHFAVRHPDRVSQLVLVDAATLGGGPPAFVGGIVSLPTVWRWARFVLQRVFTRDQLEATIRGFYVDDSFWTDSDTDAYWRAFQTQDWDAGLLALTRDGGGGTLSQEQISTIDAETLIVWGSEDTVTPLGQGERLAELIPNSNLVVIENSGHQPFEEQSNQFNTILINYLRERISALFYWCSSLTVSNTH